MLIYKSIVNEICSNSKPRKLRHYRCLMIDVVRDVLTNNDVYYKHRVIANLNFDAFVNEILLSLAVNMCNARAISRVLT